MLLALVGLTFTAWAAEDPVYVDLGLPSGTLWATTNLGAEHEYDYGDRYQWGETTPGTDYWHWSGLQYYVLYDSTLGKFTKYNATDNLTQLEATEDAATQQWGTKWCIPTKAQWDELLNTSYTTMTWVSNVSGSSVNGMRITSNANGNSIFIPAAGVHWGSSGPYYVNEWGFYWTSEIRPDKVDNAYVAKLGENSQYTDYNDRYYGCSVRPVMTGIPIDSEHFPDAQFRTFLTAQTYGADELLTNEEIARIEKLDVSLKHIADLTGIAYFTAMTELDAGDNNIASVDLSGNPGLTSVTLSENQLTSIDVSANTELVTLELSWNKITSIDLSANEKLMALGLQQNQLTSVDLTANTALEYVLMAGNPLTDEGKALLISSIRDVSEATLVLEEIPCFLLQIYSDDSGMVSLTKKQVRQLKAKGWTLYGFNPDGDNIYEYEGEEKDYSAYDLNGDGQFSIADVTFIVNKLKEMKSEE